MDAHLHILEGTRRGERIPLRASGSVVGREPGEDVDVVLPDAHVSSRHARFAFDAARGAWTVEDLDSTNGTRLDDQPVRRAVPIRPGALLVFGGGCRAALEVEGAGPTALEAGGDPTDATPRHHAPSLPDPVLSPPLAPSDGVALRDAVDLLRTRTDDARAFVRQVEALVDEVERGATASPLEAQRRLRDLAAPDGGLVDLRAGLEELVEQLGQAVRWLDETLADVPGQDTR